MAFENDTNTGRVRKMIETFALIQKSALSNQADSEVVQAMLGPLIDTLTRAGVIATTVEVSTKPDALPATLTAGPRNLFHRQAAQHLVIARNTYQTVFQAKSKGISISTITRLLLTGSK